MSFCHWDQEDDGVLRYIPDQTAFKSREAIRRLS